MAARCPVLIVNDTRVDRHHGCTAVMTVLERLLNATGFDVVTRWPSHADWRGDLEFERAFARARLVVINGEGTIHHDRPAGQRLLELGAMARSAGVPAALVNTGWEANGAALTAMLADFALVSARDEQSAAAMRAAAPSVRMVPDLSLCINAGPGAAHRQGIGVTDNVDRLRALELARLCRIASGRYVSIHHRRPWLSFVRDGLSLRADLMNPTRLAALVRLRHGMWCTAQNDLDQFLFELSGLKLLVSGRFHACTLALVSGTPFVAQASNTGKIAALINDAGLDQARAQLPDQPEPLLNPALWEWSVAEDAARLAYLDLARSRAAELATDLTALAA